jgi:hypothetical protein
MASRYIIATTAEEARAAFDLYALSPFVTDSDRKWNKRIHDTEGEAREALAEMRTDQASTPHDRSCARSCWVWHVTRECVRLPDNRQGETSS